MKIKLTENQVKKQIIDYLELNGFKTWRINNMGVYDSKRNAYYFHSRKGISDMVALKKGYPIIWIECKATGKKPNKEQKEFIDLVNKTSCDIAVCVDSIESLEQFLTDKEII